MICSDSDDYFNRFNAENLYGHITEKAILVPHSNVVYEIGTSFKIIGNNMFLIVNASSTMSFLRL